MGKKYRSVWCRCLAALLLAVMLLGNLGFLPEAKAATQYSTGFYKPMDGLQKSSGYSGFIPNRVISESGNTIAHLAQDYVTAGSWNVMAIYDGTVLKTRTALSDDAGRYVILKHSIGGKTVYSIYQHLKSISVKSGQSVSGGQVIGVAGTSGTKDGQYDRHLHLAIYSGTQDAWAPRLTNYSQNVVSNGPITYSGTTYYNPERVFSGACVIGDGSYLQYKTIDSTLRIGISTKPASGEDQCYVKEKPFEDSNDKSTSIPEGNAVKIVGAVENKYGNTWYKTADGGFVWEGDVTVWEYSKLFSLSANFQTKKSQNSHLAPYVDSGKANSYPTGTVFEVKTFVTNSYGNIWAELADGTYLNFYDKNSDVQNIYFMSHVTQPTITDATKPTGNRNAGSSFAMKGIIKAQVPFISVSCRIIDRQTGTDAAGPGTPITVKPGVSTRSVDISKTVNGVNLDTSTKFGKLAKGWYRYEINAQFGFTYNGKTFNFGSEQNFVSSEFTVGNPGTLTEEAPSAGDVSGRIPGNVNENGSFEPLDALRMLKWLAGWDVTINESNADVNGNGSADPLDGLRMLKALAGWDVVLQ